VIDIQVAPTVMVVLYCLLQVVCLSVTYGFARWAEEAIRHRGETPMGSADAAPWDARDASFGLLMALCFLALTIWAGQGLAYWLCEAGHCWGGG
jgi:hypothetical protein